MQELLILINILIDTNIWHFSYISSDDVDFKAIHEKAKNFMLQMLIDEDIKIVLTSYQCAEILEILRRLHIPKKEREELILDFKTEKVMIISLHQSDFELCATKSIHSNIHIYDYLVALPLTGYITTIYSANDHFQHQDFKEIAPVENPLFPWILREGRRPVKV
jgi:predicted nucleic acid-binding protein